jgi:hypothetical protein
MIFGNPVIAEEIASFHKHPQTLFHRISSDGAKKHFSFVSLSWTCLNLKYHTAQPCFNWIWVIYKVLILFYLV